MFAYLRGRDVTLTNCTFNGNRAGELGSAIHCYRYRIYDITAPMNIANFILWDDVAGVDVAAVGLTGVSSLMLKVSHSNIEGGAAAIYADSGITFYWGEGNIDAKPCFADPGHWNTHGTPEDANDDFWVDGDYRLLRESPCINAGDNDAVPPDATDLDGDGDVDEPVPFDLDGSPRIAAGFVDMGAYELDFQNTPPRAEAGVDQTVHPGTVVTLDGSKSSDREEDYPLTYWWQITSSPVGSTAELSEANSVRPSFIPDVPGDYTVELIVTDSLRTQSTPDYVVISTYNSAPVAEAGDDQEIVEVGSEVQLDAGQSYDDDGDPIEYFWTITESPEGSTAAISDPYSATPTFVADVHGEYVISLVTTDSFGDVRDASTMAVSFENVKPVADPGGNQCVMVGDTVILDGSGSYDGNGDPLVYCWSLASLPTGSLAEITDPTAVQTSFSADEPGTYVVSLVVNDGFVESDPVNVSIMAITTQDAAAMVLIDAVQTVNALDPESFKNGDLINTLTDKINAALEMIDQQLYKDALNTLAKAVLKKTNGCADTGAPDQNDWITTCEAQNQVYPLITEATSLLETFVY
jgi:hypothetical protein